MRKRVLAAVAAGTMVVGGATFAIAANSAPETYAFVARGDDAADALAASSLAGRLNAPIVLTATGTLPEAGRTALQSANPDNVIIAGGTAAISAGVESEIRSLLPASNVERVFGSNRFETAQQLGAKFPSIPASFLAVDGKANAAEKADDKARFGGMTPNEYQHTWVSRPGGVQTVQADGSGFVEWMAPMTITVAEESVLDVSLNVEFADAGGLPIDRDVYALVDHSGYPGNLTAAGLFNRSAYHEIDNLEVFSAQDSAGDTYFDGVWFSAEDDLHYVVAPGTHTIRFIAWVEASNTTVQAFLRTAKVHATAGMTGTWNQLVSTSSPAAADSRTVSELREAGISLQQVAPGYEPHSLEDRVRSETR